MVAGDPEAELFTRAYDDLRALAAKFFRDQPTPHTLQATALVHEVFVRLAVSSQDVRDDKHMAMLCAQAMRQVLIDSARSRNARKKRERADRSAEQLSSDDELIDLDTVLRDYEALDPRRSELVKLRVFGGFSIAECATLLGVSRSTATVDWRIARAWLVSRLGDEDAGVGVQGGVRRVLDSG